MDPEIHVLSAGRDWHVRQQADRITVGKAKDNDLALAHDPTASTE